MSKQALAIVDLPAGSSSQPPEKGGSIIFTNPTQFKYKSTKTIHVNRQGIYI